MKFCKVFSYRITTQRCFQVVNQVRDFVFGLLWEDVCVMVFLCFTIWADVFSSPLRFQRADLRCRFALCDCRGLFKVILFAALSKFYEMAAMTICAWVLASPMYRARCNPKSRFIVPKHCSTRKRCLGISLPKRFCDGHSGRLRTVLCKISPRYLPLKAAGFASLA